MLTRLNDLLRSMKVRTTRSTRSSHLPKALTGMRSYSRPMTSCLPRRLQASKSSQVCALGPRHTLPWLSSWKSWQTKVLQPLLISKLKQLILSMKSLKSLRMQHLRKTLKKSFQPRTALWVHQSLSKCAKSLALMHTLRQRMTYCWTFSLVRST